MRSVLSDEKKLSMAALSQTLPERFVSAGYAFVGHQPLAYGCRPRSSRRGSTGSLVAPSRVHTPEPELAS